MQRVDKSGRVGEAQKCVPKLADDEKVLASFVPVQLHVQPDGAEQTTAAGVGALHVTDKNVIWLSGTDADVGYSIRTRDISMHAISRDGTFACLYAHIDEADGTTECRFVPPTNNAKMLDEMYTAFSKSAELNPDAPAEGDGGDGGEEGDFFFSADEVRGNLDALTLKEQKQQDVLLAQLAAAGKPGAAAGAAGVAGGAAGGAAAAGAGAAAAADDAKAKAKQQQTLAKMNALFDALPEPTPQLAAALNNHKAGVAAAAAMGVPPPPMTKPGTAVQVPPAGAYDDATEDADGDVDM